MTPKIDIMLNNSQFGPSDNKYDNNHKDKFKLDLDAILSISFA